MGQCPNCGAPAEDWATVCEECGATLDGGQGGDRGGQQGRGGQAGQQGRSGQAGQQGGGGQPRQAQNRQQRGTRQSYGHQKSRNVGGQGQQAAGEESGSGGVSRRALLGGGIGLVALAGGGYLGYQEFLAGGSDGPEATAREFIAALDDRDADAVQSMAHSESPQDFSMDNTGDETSLSIQSVTEVEPDADRATRAYNLELTAASEPDSVTFRVELRQEDGEWKVWQAGLAEFIESSAEQTGQQSGEQAVPTASFSFDFEVTDEVNSAGFLQIAHNGGETIDHEALYVRGSGFTTPENTGSYDTSNETTIVGDSAVSWPAAAASSEGMVQTGDSISVGVTTAYDVQVVWAPQDADTTSALATDAGPDA